MTVCCVLRVATFNMHGFNTSRNYFQKSMTFHDVILLQEHMLRDVDFCLLVSVSFDFNCFASPAEHDGLVGRPAGGLCILVRKSLKIKSSLLCNFKKRVNAISLNIGGVQVLVFIVYFSGSSVYCVLFRF